MGNSSLLTVRSSPLLYLALYLKKRFELFCLQYQFSSSTTWHVVNGRYVSCLKTDRVTVVRREVERGITRALVCVVRLEIEVWVAGEGGHQVGRAVCLRGRQQLALGRGVELRAISHKKKQCGIGARGPWLGRDMVTNEK